MAQLLRFSASATALLLSSGNVAKGIDSPVSAESTFTVTQSLSDISVTDTRSVLVGEVLGLRIDGNGGYSVTDEDLDISVVTDWGDSGATLDFSVLGSDSAESSYGRVVGHSWDTPGVKTVTVTGYVYGESVRSQTISVTVIDPDTITWDEEWYVDFNGSTTDMPAETGNVNRVLSWSEWDGLDNSTAAGELIRVHFRRGATHTVAPVATESFRQSCDILYFTTFGTGAAPVIDAGGTFRDYYFHQNRIAGQRIIIDGYRFTGNYDMATGNYTGCNFTPIYDDQNRGHVSASNCAFEGCFKAAHNTDTDAALLMFNCTDNDVGWKDYGILSTGRWLLMQGVYFKADPLFGRAPDDKTKADPNFPDHAIFRTGYIHTVGFDQCVGALSHGWSPYGAETDSQPFLRLHTEDTHGVVTGYLVSVQRVDSIGSRMIVAGGPNASQAVSSTGTTIVEHCKFRGDRACGTQPGVMINAKWGGFKVQNCVTGMADVVHSIGKTNCYGVDFNLDGATGISAGAQAVPSVVRFITFYSEITGSSSAAGAYRTVGGGWSASGGNNLEGGDGHTNSGSLLDQNNFSTGDDFRPVTGTSADDNAAGDIPYFDFTHTARSGTTNKGAHDTPSTITTATAPSYTSGLTIAEVVGSVTQYQVTDWGSWTNFEPFLTEFTWQRGGADPVAGSNYAKIPRYVVNGGDSGALTLTITASNFGSALETAASNSVASP